MRLPRIERQVNLPGPAGLQAVDSGEGVFGQALGQTITNVVEVADKVNQQIAAAEFATGLHQFRKGLASFYEEHIYDNPDPSTYQELFTEYVENGLYEETFQGFRNATAQRMFEQEARQLLEQNRAQVTESQIVSTHNIGREEFNTVINEDVLSGDYAAARDSVNMAHESGLFGNHEVRTWAYVIDKAESVGNVQDSVMDTYEEVKATDGLDAALEAATQALNEAEGGVHMLATENGNVEHVQLFNNEDRASLEQKLKAQYGADLETARRAESNAVESATMDILSVFHQGQYAHPDQMIWDIVHGARGADIRNSDEFGRPKYQMLLGLANNWKNQVDSPGGPEEEFIKDQEILLLDALRRQVRSVIELRPEEAWSAIQEVTDPWMRDRETGLYMVDENGDPVRKEAGTFIRIEEHDSALNSLYRDIESKATDRLQTVALDAINKASKDGWFGREGVMAGDNRFRRDQYERALQTVYEYIDANRQNLSPAQLEEEITKFVQSIGDDPIKAFLNEEVSTVLGEGLFSGRTTVDEFEQAQIAIQNGQYAITYGVARERPGEYAEFIQALDNTHLHQADLLRQATGMTIEEIADVFKNSPTMDSGQKLFVVNGTAFTIRVSEGGFLARSDERIYRHKLETVTVPNPNTGENEERLYIPREWDEAQWEDITDQLPTDRIQTNVRVNGVPSIQRIRNAIYSGGR